MWGAERGPQHAGGPGERFVYRVEPAGCGAERGGGATLENPFNTLDVKNKTK